MSEIPTEVPVKTRKRTYDLKFKLHAINYALEHKNISKAAKDLNVNRQNIQQWIAQKAEIEKQL